MPMGANAALSAAAIAKIERWVKEGAKLDAGKDPKKPIASYAASADQVRRAEVAKTACRRARQEDRSGRPRAVEAGQPQPQTRDRAKRSLHDVQQPAERPGRRARSKCWKASTATSRGFLAPRPPIGLKKSAFTRSPAGRTLSSSSVPSRVEPDVDAEESTSGRLSVPQPYVAVVDPQGGTEGGARCRQQRKSRGRRGEERGADRRRRPQFARAPHRVARLVSRGSPPATPRAGWPSGSARIWPRRSNREAPITASSVKPPSPTGSKAGRPGQTKPWAVLTRSHPTAFARSHSPSSNP